MSTPRSPLGIPFHLLKTPFLDGEILTRSRHQQGDDEQRADDLDWTAQETDQARGELDEALTTDSEPQSEDWAADVAEEITYEDLGAGPDLELDPLTATEGWAAEDAEALEVEFDPEAFEDEASPLEAESADTTLANDRFYVDPDYITRTGEKAPEVWAYSDKIRILLKLKGFPVEKTREDLATALTRQLSTLVLHWEVAKFTAAAKETDRDKALTLYVLAFPGEARDNTGIKDLNDKVLGPEINNKYIRRRQQEISKLFWIRGDDTFVLVGQDYKTASIFTFKAGRDEFARRLALLDARLRLVLLDEILPEAEQDAKAGNDEARLKEIKKLRDTLRKKEKYTFDIYFGLTAVRPATTGQSSLETVYMLVTEALKGAGLAKLIAKGSSVTTKVARAFTKDLKPDAKTLDARGKRFDSKVYLVASRKANDIRAVMTRKPSRDKPEDYYHILVDKVWTVAFLEYRRSFVGHPDVIRDVRKKALVQPTMEYGLKYRKWFTAQKEMLELWLVALNLLDYVKDFLSGEFRTDLARYHKDALAAFADLVRRPMGPIDWARLERVLTHDLRQTKRIAVLGTASEFQFYSYAADYSERIFLMMDVRDLGVALALLYEHATGEIEDEKYIGVKLMEATFKAADPINVQRRFTYDRVVQVFRKYYDSVAKLPASRHAADAQKALGIKSRVMGFPKFEQTIQVMLGGDEVVVAAHPFYASVLHLIVSELAQTPLGDGTLNVRTAVAFSRAEGDPPPRDRVQAAHARAMEVAGLAPGMLKLFERTHRRIERLIGKLEANPKKKDMAPKFRQDLDALGLLRLFARGMHGRAMQLTPQRYARLIRLLKAGDLAAAEKDGDVELVDFTGQVVSSATLKAAAERLEQTVSKAVGKDNIHIDPPPVTQIPKWIQKLLDKIFEDDEKKKKKTGTP